MRRLLALTMLQRGLSVGVYFVATMIIARLLTPGQVGIFSLASAFLAIASVVREFGVTEFLMQDKALDHARIRAAYGVAIAVAWSMGGLVRCCAVRSRIFTASLASPMLSVLCLTFAILPFATPTTALLYRDMAVAKVLWIQTIAVVVGNVSSVVMAFMGMGYMALLGVVVNTVCMVTILLWTRRDGLQYLPTLRGSALIWSYCSKYATSGVFEQAAVNVHEFVIGRRFGFTSLEWAVGPTVCSCSFNQNITRGISRVLLPNFARHAREATGELCEQYSATLNLYTSIVWPTYALLALLAPEVIHLLFGPQWAAAAPLLQLLCIGAVIQAGYAFAGELLGGMGHAGARLRITSVTMPLWVVLCVGASFVSLKAVALAAAVQAAVVLILYVRQLNDLIGFSARHIVQATRGSAFLAACVIVPATATHAMLEGVIGSKLLILILVGMVAGCAWTAAVFVTRHPVSREVATLWHSLQRRAVH
jgi:O-antigen/teichoic acid export membrane protein